LVREKEIDVFIVDNATPEQIQKAKELKADKIVEDMLEYRWTPFELRAKGQKRLVLGFYKKEDFVTLKILKWQSF
jgi:hypothetical protein